MGFLTKAPIQVRGSVENYSNLGTSNKGLPGKIAVEAMKVVYKIRSGYE